LPLTASASSLLRQCRLETLLARCVGEQRKKFLVCAAHPFHSRPERDRRKALVGRVHQGISQPIPMMGKEKNSVSFCFPSPPACLSFFAPSAKSPRNSSRQTYGRTTRERCSPCRTPVPSSTERRVGGDHSLLRS